MRLIDADRLLRDPYFQEDRWPESHLIRMAVREQRTVDAVKVVRCKDCKEKCEYAPNQFYCFLTGLPIDEDDFCSSGERKDND